MLEVAGLRVRVGGKEILRGLDLAVRAGEVHAIMGPNGSGKSTLAQVLLGHPAYDVTQGSITFKGTEITELSPDERAKLGMFLAFQYPIEVPGVSVTNFLRTALNALSDEDVPVQHYAHRTDLPCGSTIGPITSTLLDESHRTRQKPSGNGGASTRSPRPGHACPCPRCSTRARRRLPRPTRRRRGQDHEEVQRGNGGVLVRPASDGERVSLTLNIIAPTTAEGISYRYPITLRSQGNPDRRDSIAAKITAVRPRALIPRSAKLEPRT